MNDLVPLGVALGIPFAGGMLGALATATSVKTWYKTIRKPSWTPPNWLFGPVWTALYLMMGYASFLVWKRGGWAKQAEPLTIYAIQLALNMAWTPLFFAAHNLGAASLDIIAMWVAIVATIVSFRPVIGPVAHLLLVPYLAWVSYATALTLWIWRHNPPQHGKLASE